MMSAAWIRGRVRRMHVIELRKGPSWVLEGGQVVHVPGSSRYVTVYEWGAVNTLTGEWICRDNSVCTLAEANDRARKDVELARTVWRRGIKHKSTRPKS